MRTIRVYSVIPYCEQIAPTLLGTSGTHRAAATHIVADGRLGLHMNMPKA